MHLVQQIATCIVRNTSVVYAQKPCQDFARPPAACGRPSRKIPDFALKTMN